MGPKVIFELERRRVVLEVERAPLQDFHVAITLDVIGKDLSRDYNRWVPQQPAEKMHVLSLSDDDKTSETAVNLLTDEGKEVIVKQEIKQIVAVKVGSDKATLGMFTNESDDVALYSYVSRDKTITPINFKIILEKRRKNPERAPYPF